MPKDKLHTLSIRELKTLEEKIRMGSLGMDDQTQRCFRNFHSQVLDELEKRYTGSHA